MQAEQLRDLAFQTLDDMKGRDIVVLDVRGKSTITDFMVIASGTSNRHVRSLAEDVALKAKQAGMPPLGVEDDQSGEWVLVDLGDVIVHVMQPATRDFYNLEKLWAVNEDLVRKSREGEEGEAGSGD